jgi:hypothetical protein
MGPFGSCRGINAGCRVGWSGRWPSRRGVSSRGRAGRESSTVMSRTLAAARNSDGILAYWRSEPKRPRCALFLRWRLNWTFQVPVSIVTISATPYPAPQPYMGSRGIPVQNPRMVLSRDFLFQYAPQICQPPCAAVCAVTRRRLSSGRKPHPAMPRSRRFTPAVFSCTNA